MRQQYYVRTSRPQARIDSMVKFLSLEPFTHMLSLTSAAVPGPLGVPNGGVEQV